MLKPGFGVGNDGVGRQGVHQLVTRTKHAVINCKCFFWFTLFEARVAGAQPVARSYLGGPMIALDLGLAFWTVGGLWLFGHRCGTYTYGTVLAVHRGQTQTLMTRGAPS